MDLKYDRLLDIATAPNRKTKTWKNRRVKWSDLVDKLRQCNRTSETIAEFRKMGKEMQSDIKDVGGFVGGYCPEGKRSDCVTRSVLCLDADYATDDLWIDWVMGRGNASALYSTHKHTAENPRLRLVIPLSRDVSADEYQAIGRKIAEEIGIDQFDDTSYQPQRIMYWASCPSDGEFRFEYLDAPILDPDEVLASYKDWKDVSTWATSSRVADISRYTPGKKQEDPAQKKGIVGAFCRAYTITEAIEDFIETYAPTADPNRYTYTEGSTAGGVVIYDDKWSYSNHATDPASSVLCNAFDLVRIHMFGHLDADANPETTTGKLPSFKAMSDFASQDAKVKLQIVEDMNAEAMIDFAPPAAAEDEEDEGDSWKSELDVTDKGILAQTIGNVVVILRHDKELRNALAYNEFDHTIVIRKDLPWKKVTKAEPWVDSDDAALRYFIENRYNLSCKDKIYDAVNVVAMENSFHPVREYLNSCVWDGVPRAETVLIDYLGAEDTPYTRTVTRKALCGAVARIFRPGCKFDYVIMIKGVQGAGKSTLINRLGGQWYSDTLTTMQGKDSYEQVHGVWLVELAELASMRRSEVETVKQFISKQVDRFRPAYGRRTQEYPRQCVFWGTTNEATFLRDSTGNRRFWVVDTPNHSYTTKSPTDLDPETVRQIWAEAVKLLNDGEKLYLDREMAKEAAAIQENYAEESPRFGIVEDFLDRKLPVDWYDMDLTTRRTWLESGVEGTEIRKTVCYLEIWSEAFYKAPEQISFFDQKELREILDRMPGWRRNGKGTRTVKPYGRQRYYEREEDEDDII